MLFGTFLLEQVKGITPQKFSPFFPIGFHSAFCFHAGVEKCLQSCAFFLPPVRSPFASLLKLRFIHLQKKMPFGTFLLEQVKGITPQKFSPFFPIGFHSAFCFHAGVEKCLQSCAFFLPPVRSPFASLLKLRFIHLQKKMPFGTFLLEQVKGIEPSYQAWEARVLPLNYTCIMLVTILAYFYF